ncbi:MAG: hypothetical protein QOJ07_231 [Thermoleophilaceae bacterium]|nr:hypothetical protein [Thermoleophilaceae bacterium]
MRRATLLITLAAVLAGAVPAAAANAIQTENAKPGTDAWDVQPADPPPIEGYASQPSSAPGERIDLHVRAPEGSSYRVELYRLGWYGGLGGRLIACSPACDAGKPAVAQPATGAPDAKTGLLDAGWKTTDSFRVGGDWVSGYYQAVLRITAGPSAGGVGRVPVIVREGARRRAEILLQAPVNAWQAYNRWGGRSLYESIDPAGKPAVKVSFDRPLAEDHALRPTRPWTHELQTMRWLERQGYDVAYSTDVDTDRHPAELLRHRIAFVSGHDEYWSGAMRAGWDRAQARGTNIAVIGANVGYWQIRYEHGDRTIVEYRTRQADPVKDGRRRTVQFRALRPRHPECLLFGVQYEYYAQRTGDDPPTPYNVVAPPGDPWLAGTGLATGDVLPGLVGYEWDGYDGKCTPGTTTSLLHDAPGGPDGRPHNADLARSVARSSGARVFASGSLQLAWGLDSYGGHTPDARVQGIVANALADLGRPAAPARLHAARAGGGRVRLSWSIGGRDPRVKRVVVSRGGRRVCASGSGSCVDSHAPRGAVRYAAVAVDAWGTSVPRASNRLR